MSKAWQAYALHILDAIDRIRLIESRVREHLHPLAESVKAMLAADPSNNA